MCSLHVAATTTLFEFVGEVGEEYKKEEALAGWIGMLLLHWNTVWPSFLQTAHLRTKKQLSPFKHHFGLLKKSLVISPHSLNCLRNVHVPFSFAFVAPFDLNELVVLQYFPSTFCLYCFRIVELCYFGIIAVAVDCQSTLRFGLHRHPGEQMMVIVPICLWIDVGYLQLFV